MNLGITDRLAVVVGASKGLGREVALALTRQGARVAAIARSADLLESMALGLEGWRLQADVMDHPNSTAVEVISRFGSPDIVYYALGGSWRGVKDPFSTAAEYAEVWRYNLGVAIEMNRAFIPHMIRRGWGRVVLTSSDGVRRNVGHAPYTSAKHAVEGYVSILGRELAATGVVVSAVAPGPIYTEGRWLYSQSAAWNERYFDEHMPARRFGDAKEAADVVCFLCSERASFMQGAVVPVNGGSR